MEKYGDIKENSDRKSRREKIILYLLFMILLVSWMSIIKIKIKMATKDIYVAPGMC